MPLISDRRIIVKQDDENTWPPSNTVLGNDILFRVLATKVSTRSRSGRRPEDFDENGDILKKRPNRGHIADARHDGVLLDIVFKGYYVLIGDVGATTMTKRSEAKPWLADFDEKVTSLYDTRERALDRYRHRPRSHSSVTQ